MAWMAHRQNIPAHEPVREFATAGLERNRSVVVLGLDLCESEADEGVG
jgi:hypothetical protein